MIALVLNQQVVFNGLVRGLVIALLAVSLVLVFNSSKVINFAAGNLGLLGAGLFMVMALTWNVPYWLAVSLGLLVGVLFGAIVELIVVRRLFKAPRVILLVATIGIAQVGLAATVALPSVPDSARFPQALRSKFYVGDLLIQGPQVLVLVATPLVAVLLAWFLTATTTGRCVRAAAANPDLARLSGVNPKTVSTIVWALAGGLATLTMILITSLTDQTSAIANLGPSTLLRGLVAAAIVRFRSVRGAFVAAIAIGIGEQLLNLNLTRQQGFVDLALLVAVMVAVGARARERSAGDATFSHAPKVMALPARLEGYFWVRHLDRLVMLIMLVLGTALVFIVDTPSKHQLYASMLCYAIVGLSLTVLTGWAGQLSLGQMAFGGIGALVAAAFTNGLTVDWAIGGLQLLNFELYPLPFVLTMPLGALVAAGIAAAVGAGAFRVRGLLLAVSTFAFAFAAQNFLYRLDALNGGNESRVPWRRGELYLPKLDMYGRTITVMALVVLVAVVVVVVRAVRRQTWRSLYITAASLAVVGGGLVALTSAGLLDAVFYSDRPFLDPSVQHFDLSEQRTYYLFVLALLAVCTATVSRLRRSGVGRVTIAVRDNPATAEAYTVRSGVVKLRAFAFSGFLAGLGGALLAGIGQAFRFTDTRFQPAQSLVLVAVVVIGGVSTPAGAIVGSVWVIGLPALWPSNELVPLLTSGLGLLLLLLYFPGGLVHIAHRIRGAIYQALERRLPPVVKADSTPRALVGRERAAAEPVDHVLRATDVSVRFGGLRANDRVSIEVGANEIVGLIGTNGAGKTTLMNAVGGYVAASGRVDLLGVDVSHASAPTRARLGLGRTFQAASLFPELTVRETVMVALEARGRSGMAGTLLFSPRMRVRETAKRSQASDLIDFLGLGRYADRLIAELSTGTRRIVELAGLLALDARLLCLDEPTAGIAQREAEAMGPLLVEIRRQLGASMLIIEHDMPLIMSISDRVYCLEAGRVIAEGDPSSVRNNPMVIASYLGSNQATIERSDALKNG